MADTTSLRSAELRAEMTSFIGRHADKSFDWDAFPANSGFPELARAQMRYIGAGGSPKVNDPATLRPGHYTLSMIHQPPGTYAACHEHEIEESFLALSGVLTIGWAWDGEVIEVRLGPKDLCLNASWRPHGFRNDGVDPVLMSIMVASGKPMPPRYLCHPRDADPALARAFGATPDKVLRLAPDSNDPRHREFARHVVRYREQPVERHPAGFARKVYIGEGGAPATHFRADLIHLPVGHGVALYARDTEDSYFVLDGVLTVGWEENGRLCEERLGPRDLILNPPGRLRRFRNDGMEACQFLMAVGTPSPETVRFQALA